MNATMHGELARPSALRFEWRHAWQIAAVLFVSLSLHWIPKALSPWLDPALSMAALMVFDALIVATLARSSRSWRTTALLGILLLLVYLSRRHEFVALPSIVLNLGVAAVFGITLLPGRTPLIVAMVTHALGNSAVDAEFARYLRRLNVAWCLFFVAMAITCAVLAFFAPFSWWSLFANVLSWPLIAAMFVLEYGVRRWFFPQLPAHTPLQTIVSALAYPAAAFRSVVTGRSR